MPKNVKLNRRSVGTQSDLLVGVNEVSSGGKTATGRKLIEADAKFSSLCKKSAYRNLLQRSITVDGSGKVNLTLDFIKSGRSRGTQTTSGKEGRMLEVDSTRLRLGREESFEMGIPMHAKSPDISLSPSLLSQGSVRSSNSVRPVKGHYEEKPGTSNLVSDLNQADSASLQAVINIEDHGLSAEGSLAVIYSCDDRGSLQSRISFVPHTNENQASLRRQSNEAVLLVEDYQSYDVMNAARRLDNVTTRIQDPRKSCCKRSKRKRKNDTVRPVPIFPDPSVQSLFVCRICHEGEEVEPLMRPCLCKGSVGYIHGKCLKIWLEQSNTSRCEICGYPYAIRQTKKYRKCNSVIVFIRSVVDRRALTYDFISFVAVTPLCIIGIAMCVRASVMSGTTESVPGTNFQMGNVTRAGMIMLTTTIVVAYSVWLYTLISYHYKSWKRWYNSCYEVEVIPVNLTSQERLETVHRLEEESRRRSSRVEDRSSLTTVVETNSSYHPYGNFFQRRLFTAGRVQSLPQ